MKQIRKFKEFRKFFRKFILKNYGRKCPDYCFDCPVCRGWRIYEDFDSWVHDVESLAKWESRKKINKIGHGQDKIKKRNA